MAVLEARGSLAADILEGRRAALRRLFGPAVEQRGAAIGADVVRLATRLKAGAKRLHAARHTQAHRYGTGEAVSLPLHGLGTRLKTLGRMMKEG